MVTPKRRQVRFALVTSLCVALIGAISVSGGSAAGQETKKSTIRGAGIGALLGQAIGGDTGATVVGGVVGAGVGRVVGKEKEKAQAAATPPPPPPKPKPAPAPAPEPKPAPAPAPKEPEAVDPAEALPNTIWKLEKLQPSDRVPPFFSKVVTFLPDGYLQTITTDPEGNTTLSEEKYNAVGDTIVVNRPEYTIQARFEVDGDQLILSAEDFSAILKRVVPE